MSLTTSLYIFGAKYLYLVALAIAGVSFLRMKRDKQKELILLTIISFPLVFIVLKIGAYLYFDPRPFVVGNFTPLVFHEPDNGFPSDHTILLSSVAMLFVIHYRKVSYILFALALIVAISRVYVGVHHTVDVLGAFLMSIVVIALSHITLSHFKIYNQVWQK